MPFDLFGFQKKLQVIRSNNFAVSPVLLTLPTLDGFDVRFRVP